jgi:hypothetical protein
LDLEKLIVILGFLGGTAGVMMAGGIPAAYAILN